MFMSEIEYIYKPHNATGTNKHIIHNDLKSNYK